ncbi:MAG: amidohydrolase family protein [Cyclobacteriaceae bacterium]
MKSFINIGVLLLLIKLTSCGNQETKKLVEIDQNSGPILITGVNIFDGKTNSLIENRDVFIKNGFIATIADSIVSTEGYQTIDGRGKTLMPGLIDSHVHLSGSGAVPWENESANMEYNLSAYLYSGITAVYDLGGLAGDLSKIAEKVDNRDIIGPSIYHTHIPITVKNSHPIPLTKQMLPWPLKSLVNAISPTIDDISDAKNLIEKYLKNDVDYVKVICDQIPPGSPEMTFEQLKALIDEAHKSDKKVFAHIGSPENAISAVEAGADILAHGIWRGKLSPEQADIIAASKIPIVYTISGFYNVSKIHNGEYQPSDLDRYLVPDHILSPVTGENGKDVHQQDVMNSFFEDVNNQSAFWLHNFRLLHDRGVPILVGTDSNLPGTYAGSTYFQEMNLLKKFGLSNFEILTGATYLSSRLFLDNPDFGLVGEGKRANLLLIDGNPLENIELIQSPHLILLNGNIVEKL